LKLAWRGEDIDIERAVKRAANAAQHTPLDIVAHTGEMPPGESKSVNRGAANGIVAGVRVKF
jgi:hypothetical protein